MQKQYLEAMSSNQASIENDSQLAIIKDSLRKSICGNSIVLLQQCHNTPVFETDILLSCKEVMMEVRLPMDPNIEKLRSKFTDGYKIGGLVSLIQTDSKNAIQKRTPFGKLVQIKYALMAVGVGQTLLGIKASSGVVIATEKKLPSFFVNEATVNKIQSLTPNMGVVYNWPSHACAGTQALACFVLSTLSTFHW